MPNIIITKGTYDKFGALRPVFKNLLDAFLAENSIQIVHSITNTIAYNQLASKFVRFVFEKIQLTNLVDEEKICLTVKTYGNKQAIQHHYINFDYANHTITWRGEVYHLEPNVLVHFKASEKSAATEAGVYDPSAVMLIIKKQIMKAERAHVVDDIIAKLQGSLIIAENDYSVGGIQKSNGNYHDRIRVMLDNKVVAIGIAIDTKVDKSFCREYNHVLGLKVVKTEIRPEDIKVVQEEFGAAISDKNNKKCFYVGDGVNAAFVTRVGDKYLTLNPTDNVAKLANRIGSHKFIPAKLENVEASKLVSQLSNGRYACTYGMPLTTIIHDGGWNNGSGAAVCTKPIHYIIDKTLRGTFAIDQLEQGYLNSLSRNREQQLEQIGIAVITHLKSLKGTDLEPGEAIEWNGVVIVRNRNNFAVTIDSVRLKKGYFLNTECRSIRVEVKTFCHRYDYNAKLRGNLKKLQTIHQPGTKVYLDGKPVDFDIMLNGENIKGVIPNLEIYANAFDSDLVFGTDGKLYRNDAEVTEDEIKSWISANTKQIVIEQVISADYFAQYKSEFDKRGDQYSANADGSYTLKSTVNAIMGTAHYAVELSSNPENFTDSYQGVPGQMILSTMNGNIKTTIIKHQEAAAKNLDLFDLTSYSAEFNLTHVEDRAEFDEKLNLKGNETIEMIFKKLAQKWAKGINLSVIVNNYTYSVCLPTKLLYHYIVFDSSGYPINEQEMINNIVSLLKLASTAGADVVLIKEYMFYVKAYLERWVKDIEGNKNSFVRGNRAIKSFGMKVITSADIGSKNGIPEIVVNPLNPLVTGNSPLVYKKDKIREGSIVLFYRNPLPFFTPAIVRFSENVDPLVVGVSPLVWTKACLADADGDSVFLIPMSRFGIADNNIKGAKQLLNHSLGMELFNEVMSGIESPIEDFVSGKSIRPEQLVSSVAIEEFNDVLGAVNQHYSIRVGQGYSLMHDAICSFVDKYHRDEQITDNELIAIKQCAFLFYEEYGLGGYKPDSEAQFAFLEDKANQVIRGKKSLGNAIEDYIVAAQVRTVIARAEEGNGLYHSDLYDSAIQNGVIRCLSKGHLTYEGVLSNLFAAYSSNPVEGSHPFSIALNAYSQFFTHNYSPMNKQVKVKSAFGSWN